MRAADPRVRTAIGLAALLVLVTAVGVEAAPVENAAPAPDNPTFYRDVLPLLQQHCQDCHRPGGAEISGMIAPMSLVDYADVRPWAKSIRKAVSSRAMPPWGASAETSVHIVNNRSLEASAIETIVAWVDRGAPAGKADEAPEPRVFEADATWIIGEPDLVVTMPEPLVVSDDAVDYQPYVTFHLTPEQLPEPRWIRAVEYKPNCDMIHHLTATVVPPPDAEGNERQPFFLGGIASGSEPREYPPGFGRILHPGSQIVLSLHYSKEPGPGTGISNQVSMGLVFYDTDEEVEYEIRQTRIGRFFDFEIPPGHSSWKTGASMEFDQWALLTSMWPHMHYRGKDMKYTIFYPDGREELLLDVVRYDFAWQMRYTLDRPKLIPPGTRIEVESHHDNSAAMGARIARIDTTKPVKWGLASTDEMMHGFVSWAPIEEAEAKKWQTAP